MAGRPLTLLQLTTPLSANSNKVAPQKSASRSAGFIVAGPARRRHQAPPVQTFRGAAAFRAAGL